MPPTQTRMTRSSALDQASTRRPDFLRFLRRTREVRAELENLGSLFAGSRELRDALKTLGLNTNASEAMAILKKYDTDRSGLLDLGEFARLVVQLRQLLSACSWAGAASWGKLAAVSESCERSLHPDLRSRLGACKIIRAAMVHASDP